MVKTNIALFTQQKIPNHFIYLSVQNKKDIKIMTFLNNKKGTVK